MGNFHVERRLERARELAGPIARLAGVQAIVVAGSVGRGYADAYSDIEIPIFWDALPTAAVRHDLVAQIGGRFLYGYDGPAQEDQLMIDGLQVDLWHVTVAEEEATLDRVVGQLSTAAGDLHALDTLCSCVPLHGQALIDGWKRRAAVVPQELWVRVVQEHLNQCGLNDLALLALRDNPTAFAEGLARLHESIFRVLQGLNRRYFTTLKWLYPTLDQLAIVPAGADRRFRSAYGVPYAESIEVSRLILDDVIQLVEEHLPEVDTRRVKSRMAYVRATF
ncbi:MAG TPA: hypothetical protein PLC98_16285 [Anaerolineales bacterium]|nr:hypothetical protein [Anaerolineales bacterium]